MQPSLGGGSSLLSPQVFCPAAGTSSQPSPAVIENAHTFLQPDLSTETGTAGAGNVLETKHSGIAAGRRVFVGPSFEGQGRKARPRGASVSTPGAQGSMSKAGGGTGRWKARDCDTTEDNSPFSTWGARRKRRPSVSTTAPSVRSPTLRTRGASVSHQNWTGTSFEIGGDVRELARRRDERLKREREEPSGALERDGGAQWAVDQREVEENKRMWKGQRRAATAPIPKTMPSPNVTISGSSFVTARSRLPSFTPSFFRRPSDSSWFAPSSPPSPLPAPLKRPALHVHTASHPFVESPAPASIHSTRSAQEVLQTSFLNPFRRSKDRSTDNGSSLGNGQPPPSQTSATSLLPLAGSTHLRTASEPAPHSPPLVGVRFDDPNASGAQPPASPAAVLARADSKADAAPPDFPPPPPKPKETPDDVIKTARMLVRVDWSQRDDLPDSFDEHVARKYPTTKGEAWQELGLVWRRGGWLELWDETRFGGIYSHKKLKCVIPLRSKTTHLSLYSSTDLIFCLTDRPESHGIFSRSTAPLATTASAAAAPIARIPSADDNEEEAARRRAPHSKASKRGYVHLRSSGTNIFLFCARTHSSAKEWMWELYLGLGGHVPRVVEVSVPGLGAKLRLPVPIVPTEDGESETWAPLCPKEVVDRCVDQLGSVKEWKDLVEDAKRQGANFRLAWRRESVLDWIREDDGATRDWIVIGGGVVFRQESRPEPVLELRPATHYPTTCRVPSEPGAHPSRLSTTVRISEPPGIEGFLIRHRPNGGGAERVYLTSRMGLLFLCRPGSAHPPEPPLSVHETLNNPAAIVLAPFVFGMASLASSSNKKRKGELISRAVAAGGIRKSSHNVKSDRERDWTLKSMDAARVGLGKALEKEEGDLEDKGGDAFLDWLEQEEKRRAFLQITDARGFVHLSELETVEPELSDEGDAREMWLRVQDFGGDEGMQTAEDKAKLKKMRSFVVITRSGVKVKFECHSIDVREEMVERLRSLATYWRRRERVDAIQLMELSPSSGLVSRLPPRGTRRHGPDGAEEQDDGEPPLSRSEVLSSPHLSHLYNWCILDGCRALMKEGVMHVRKGMRGVFRLRNVLLLPGTLVEYQSIARDMHGQPLPTPYHRRRAVVSLRDVYVYSGSLASSFIPITNPHSWNPGDESEHQFPRCYPGTDGLRTADEAEDCTFVIVRLKHGISGKNAQLGQKGHNARVYRTRSKLERDQFVYAINAAIEAVMRGETEREERLRDFASWLKHKRP